MLVPAPDRIGIVRLSAIGDVVHALPLAMGLREAYPRARITWVVQAGPAPLLAGHAAVDEVLVFPRRASPGGWWRFLQALRACRFDWTLDPQGNLKSGTIAWLSGAPRRAGLHWRDCKEPPNALLNNRHGRRARGAHGIDRAWQAGAPLGVGAGPDRFGLRATAAERDAWRARCRRAGADPAGPMLALHLTDPADPRAWPVEHQRAFVREAAASGLQVVLNGVGGRRGLARSLVGPNGVFDLTGQDDLRGLLAQFDDMAERPGNLLVSPDSGPVHLADAVGLRVVCLSGPQDPRRTGPRSGSWVEAWEGLPCAPCLERRCVLRPPTAECMRRLTPDRVWSAIRSRAGAPSGERRGPARPRSS